MQFKFPPARFSRHITIVLFGVIFAVAHRAFSADSSTVALPDSPIGKALSGWLEATNSGDRDTIARFLSAPSPIANTIRGWITQGKP